MSKRKIGLTRRLQNQYQAILRGQGCLYTYCYYRGMSPNYVAKYNAVAALYFARYFGTRKGVDQKKLQRVILSSEDPVIIYKYASVVEWANIKRCQIRIIQIGNPSFMRKFALNIKGAEVQKLEAYALIMEVMGT